MRKGRDPTQFARHSNATAVGESWRIVPLPSRRGRERGADRRVHQAPVFSIPDPGAPAAVRHIAVGTPGRSNWAGRESPWPVIPVMSTLEMTRNYSRPLAA